MFDTTTTLNPSAIAELRDRVAGEVIAPGDAGYDDGRAAFNVAFEHRPALVVMAEGAADVVAAVRFAAGHGLDLAVQATGHGVVLPADDALLINTARMTGVTVDPEARTARIEAGTRWGEVLAATQTHGLAPLLGSSPTVGAVGYTLGGGLGWLARKYGLAADSAVSFEVVTAEGEQLTASAEENTELFWGLRGGGGGLAIVTAMTVRLFPVEMVYGGGLIYPGEMAADVMRRWRDWLPSLPEEMTSSVKIMNFPDMEIAPPPLRGKTVVMVLGAYCGALDEGKALVDQWREWQAPMMDMFGPMPFAEVAHISNDPTDPMPAYVTGAWLRELSDAAIDAIVRYGTLQEARLPRRRGRQRIWRPRVGASARGGGHDPRAAAVGGSRRLHGAIEGRTRSGAVRHGIHELFGGRREERARRRYLPARDPGPAGRAEEAVRPGQPAEPGDKTRLVSSDE
jgi:FAD/FMN-containing dehydrogenase